MTIDEETAIDKFYELIELFSGYTKKYNPPRLDHNLKGFIYTDHPFHNAIDKNLRFIEKDLALSDLKEDLSIGMIGGTKHNSCRSIRSLKSVTDIRVRGAIDFKAAYFCKRIYEMFAITFEGDYGETLKKGAVGSCLYGIDANKNIVELTLGLDKKRNIANLEKDKAIINMYNCLSHYHEMLWHVQISAPNGFGVRIAIKPDSSKFFFKNRDVDFGKNRKAAIKNFVKEHNRYIRESETETKVREHLRGSEKFSWFGLEAEVFPAAADLRRLSLLKSSCTSNELGYQQV